MIEVWEFPDHIRQAILPTWEVQRMLRYGQLLNLSIYIMAPSEDFTEMSEAAIVGYTGYDSPADMYVPGHEGINQYFKLNLKTNN